MHNELPLCGKLVSRRWWAIWINPERCSAWPDWQQGVIYLAPPPANGSQDTRISRLLQALRGRTLPQSLVYASTSGVYGDCAGAWVAESRPVRPETARAMRRVDAEQQLRWWGASTAVCSSVLRIPGIYAADRVGGDPRERIHKRTGVLHASEDVYTKPYSRR